MKPNSKRVSNTEKPQKQNAESSTTTTTGGASGSASGSDAFDLSNVLSALTEVEENQAVKNRLKVASKVPTKRRGAGTGTVRKIPVEYKRSIQMALLKLLSRLGLSHPGLPLPAMDSITPPALGQQTSINHPTPLNLAQLRTQQLQSLTRLQSTNSATRNRIAQLPTLVQSPTNLAVQLLPTQLQSTSSTPTQLQSTSLSQLLPTQLQFTSLSQIAHLPTQLQS
ncbi:hypothetical protein O6P43_003260 [Quillaja saponaria]|uniref:Uncharacterized protein n=1 Tax=Quillaja saponaria TaxID=32244 RepID=A0AAD7QE89_QUISA|nr:hypothetical protein O6P43_003260 [Quillaja saponaria]